MELNKILYAWVITANEITIRDNVAVFFFIVTHLTGQTDSDGQNWFRYSETTAGSLKFHYSLAYSFGRYFSLILIFSYFNYYLTFEASLLWH